MKTRQATSEYAAVRDMTRIRKFNGSDSDYEAIVAIDNAVWPEFQSTIDIWKHWDGARDPKFRFQRWVLECDGHIVAFGACGDRHWAYKPGQYFIGMNVHPDEEGQGCGSELFEHLTAQVRAMQPKVVQITSNTREDKPRGIRFLEDRGFKWAMRVPRSLLDVQQFDPAPFAEKLARIQASSIEITTLAELMRRDPDWLQKLHGLETELVKDVPYHDELTPMTLDVFEQQIVGSPNLYPEAQFIAIDGSRWVGMSALWRNPGNEKRLETGLTGVVRDYRRRGLATALKVSSILFAQGLGIEEIETDNEENNPMYQINLQLGYVPQPAFLDYVKDMTE